MKKTGFMFLILILCVSISGVNAGSVHALEDIPASEKMPIADEGQNTENTQNTQNTETAQTVQTVQMPSLQEESLLCLGKPLPGGSVRVEQEGRTQLFYADESGQVLDADLQPVSLRDGWFIPIPVRPGIPCELFVQAPEWYAFDYIYQLREDGAGQELRLAPGSAFLLKLTFGIGITYIDYFGSRVTQTDPGAEKLTGLDPVNFLAAEPVKTSLKTAAKEALRASSGTLTAARSAVPADGEKLYFARTYIRGDLGYTGGASGCNFMARYVSGGREYGSTAGGNVYTVPERTWQNGQNSYPSATQVPDWNYHCLGIVRSSASAAAVRTAYCLDITVDYANILYETRKGDDEAALNELKRKNQGRQWLGVQLTMMYGCMAEASLSSNANYDLLSTGAFQKLSADPAISLTDCNFIDWYCATQVLIWEWTQGFRTFTADGSSTTVSTKAWFDTLGSGSAAQKIYRRMEAYLTESLKFPSFSVRSDSAQTIPSYELSPDPDSGGYQIVLRDTNNAEIKTGILEEGITIEKTGDGEYRIVSDHLLEEETMLILKKPVMESTPDNQGLFVLSADASHQPAVLGTTIENPLTAQLKITTPRRTGSVILCKYDCESTDQKPLSGARIRLEKKESSAAEMWRSVGEPQETGSDGKTVFSDLEEGTYRLIEEKAPEGYLLLAEPVEFELGFSEGEFEKTLYLGNRAVFSVPETGGAGGPSFIAGCRKTGRIMAAVGSILLIAEYLFDMRKKKERF